MSYKIETGHTIRTKRDLVNAMLPLDSGIPVRTTDGKTLRLDYVMWEGDAFLMLVPEDEEASGPAATTPDAFAEEMVRLGHVFRGDAEALHSAADSVLMRVLRQLGYSKGVDIYAKFHKWYS